MMLTETMRSGKEHEDGNVKRILFVCTGNTCRSPMAAAVLNDMARGREGCSLCQGRESQALVASSAGLYAMPNAPITPHAVRALEEAGVASLPDNDYLHHTARRVTAEMMETADEVVAITDAHAMELMMRFPEQASKIVTLGTDIPDPFGGDIATYRSCLAMLSYGIALRYFGGEEQTR